MSYEPTCRSPLRRTKKRLIEPAPAAAAVNGSRDKENGSEDEGGMRHITIFSLIIITVNSQSAAFIVMWSFFDFYFLLQSHPLRRSAWRLEKQRAAVMKKMRWMSRSQLKLRRTIKSWRNRRNMSPLITLIITEHSKVRAVCYCCNHCLKNVRSYTLGVTSWLSTKLYKSFINGECHRHKHPPPTPCLSVSLFSVLTRLHLYTMCCSFAW